MSIIHADRRASADETAREMDRRGAVIENLETTIGALRERVRDLVGALEASRKAWVAYGQETDPEISVPTAHRDLLRRIDAALTRIKGDGK